MAPVDTIHTIRDIVVTDFECETTNTQYRASHMGQLSRFCPEWMEWWPNKSRTGPQVAESAYITCKSGGYLSVSGGQLALVMAKVTTMNHCEQNTQF